MTRSRQGFRKWTWAHRVTAAVFFALLILGREEWFPWLAGALSATRLFDVVTLVDPLAGLEVLVATLELSATALLGVGLLVVLWAVLGRAFCGWLCPVGFILDVNDDIRSGLRRLAQSHRVPWPQWSIPRQTKYWLLGAALAMSAIAGLPVFATISPINLVALGAVFQPGPETWALLSLPLLEYAFPRAFCRSLCPLGAFYALIGRRGILRMRVQPEANRLQCRQCSVHCSMGLRVMEDYVLPGRGCVDAAECTRCGSCSDVCLGTVLRLGFRTPSGPALDVWSAPSHDDGPSGEGSAGSCAEPSTVRWHEI